MTLRILISLSLLLLAWQKADAQLLPADDFFNGGAQYYISNNIPAALEKVESGLKIYPDDAKLQKLEKLLKQQQKQNQQQQKQQQQKQSQSQKNSQQQQQKNQQPPKSDEQKKNPPPKPPEQQKKSDAEKQKEDQQKKSEDQAKPGKPGQMTPQEAKRLLDAQKGNEQMLQLKPKAKPQDSSQPVKDW